jgi:chromate transporter
LNFWLVYLLLLKAMLTSFSGMSSVPIVRQDFVVTHHALTDRQLNTALVAGQTGPGPIGLYLVSVGYFASGVPGAMAATLAVMTPAFLVLPLLRWMAKRSDSPPVRRAINGVLLASAGLIVSATMPLTRDAITGPVPIAILAASFTLLAFTHVQSAWVMLGAAAAGLAAKLIGLTS